MAHFSKDFNQFFIELAGNNHKEWFDDNRKRYETTVKKPFQAFVQTLLDHFAKDDARFKEVTPSDCIFRINRDIRFSKDKTPYKLFTSAVVAPQGKKTAAIGGIYFELGPESVNVYGGIYEIDKDNLYEVRRGIAEHLDEFEALVANPAFETFFGGIRGEANKIIPSEFRDAANKQPLIFNKQFYFMKQLDADLVHSDELFETLVQAYEVALPFHRFVSQFIHPAS